MKGFIETHVTYYLHPNMVFVEHIELNMPYLIWYTKSIRISMDEKLSSRGVFIDVKKAFDTVDHKILLDKLNYYGFREIVNQWFFSYLATRTQTTEIHSYISDKH